jgi:uncharacterized protein YgiM (DUF1202 family)
MKKQEIKLIKDLYRHFQPQTEVNDELINSCFEQYGSIRGVLMNLVLKFQPDADVTDDYLDKKLSEYGLMTTEVNEDAVEEAVVAPVESSKVNEDVVEEEVLAPVESSKVEVKEHPKKKSNVFKWAAIVIVVISLGAVGANLFYQNQLLQSSLDKTEDLLDQQRELDANDEAIEEDTSDYYEENTAVSGTEADPEVEGQRGLDYNTYAKSNVSNLNVRSTPEISDNVIGMLQLGDRVEVLYTVKSEMAAIQNGMLNKDTFIEIEGNDVLFKHGKVFQIIGEIGDAPVAYRIKVDYSNHEAIIVKSNIDLIESEVWLKINYQNQKSQSFNQGYVYQKFLTNEVVTMEEQATETDKYFKIQDPDGYTNMRDAPGGSIIRRVLPNEKFKVSGLSGKYKVVKFDNGETGYIHNSRIVKEQISQKSKVYHEVYNTYMDQEAPYLILRSEPQSKSQKIAEMSDGTKLVELSKGYGNNGKWIKVRVVESGKVGYAHSKWIREIYEN